LVVLHNETPRAIPLLLLLACGKVVRKQESTGSPALSTMFSQIVIECCLTPLFAGFDLFLWKATSN
jgi:hypothetical protein